MLIAILLVGVVNMLLLTATEILFEEQGSFLRRLAGACLGAVFAGLSMVSQFAFFTQFPWRVCSLVLAGLLAFGCSKPAVPKLMLFALLHLSLGGITERKNEVLAMVLGAAGICFACIVVGKRKGVMPVELTYGGQTVQITALRDTGNTLRDPITGKQVLIVGADVAQMLTGLTLTALQDPVGSIGTIPGLRLIPYQTVGNTGMMLAINISNAKIGNRRGNTLVAFSPQIFNGHYQALTGGMV